MRAIRIAAAVLASVVVLITAGCGDDNGTTPSGPSLQVSDLVGTWEATGMVATDEADASVSVDLIALGAAANAKFEANRRVAFVSSFEGRIEASTGVVTIGDGTLFVAGDGTQSSETLGCGYENDCLTVTYDAEPYDFDGDGTDETARITMVLERCGDEVALTDAYGDWVATKWELTNDENPSEIVDLVGLGNAATVTIGANSGYTLRLTPAGEPMETETGSLRAVGTYLVALADDDPGNPVAFACELGTMTMTLRQTGSGYDFDDDGMEESATAVVDWVRR